MKIRAYESRYAASVSTLIRTTMRVSNQSDYPLEKLQPLIDYFSPQKVEQLSHERTCIVAEHGGKIVGTVGLEDETLVTFFVDPVYQRQGIGSALLESVEAFAVSQGTEEIQVESSLTAMHFYKRKGYIRAGDVIKGTAGPQIQMHKKLTESSITSSYQS